MTDRREDAPEHSIESPLDQGRQPILLADHGQYRLRSLDGTMMQLARVRPDRAGDLTAEVTVTTRVGAVIDGVRMALASLRDRQLLARELATRIDPEVSFVSLVDRAFAGTLHAVHEGAQAVLLCDVAVPEGDGELLSPFALGSHTSIVFGDAAVAKSLIVLAAAASIHTGNAYLGVTPTETRRVLYLDYELDAPTQAARLRRIAGEAVPDLVYARCHLPLVDDVERIRDLAREASATYLIIDSLAYAAGLRPEEAESALACKRAIDAIGLGTLAVAHINRARDTTKPFGSTFWHANARRTWYLEAAGRTDTTLTVLAHNRKQSLGAEEREPRAYDITFGTRISFASRDATGLAAKGRGPSGRELVLEALAAAGGSLTYVEIEARTGIKLNSIGKVVARNPDRFAKVPGKELRVDLVARKAA